MIKIGIDPDSQKSGIAIIENGKIKLLESLRFFDLISVVDEYVREARIEHEKYIIVIEKGEENKALFNAKQAALKAKTRDKIAVAANVGMRTGKNFEVTDLLIEYCTINKYDFKTYTPNKGTPKLSHAFLSRVFEDLPKKTNEDKRDALRCIL